MLKIIKLLNISRTTTPFQIHRILIFPPLRFFVREPPHTYVYESLVSKRFTASDQRQIVHQHAKTTLGKSSRTKNIIFLPGKNTARIPTGFRDSGEIFF